LPVLASQARAFALGYVFSAPVSSILLAAFPWKRLSVPSASLFEWEI
jgi:hypothetical protein